jgi:hypothetical protein
MVEFRFEAHLRVEWGDLLALIKGHVNALRAIGLALTRDASRWCLPLRAVARCPIDACHPITIIISIRAVRVRQLLGLTIAVPVARKGTRLVPPMDTPR